MLMIDVRIFSLPILFPSLLLRWALEISRAQCVHPPQCTTCLSSFLPWHYSDDNFLYYLFPSPLWMYSVRICFLPSILYLVYIHICQAFDIAFFFLWVIWILVVRAMSYPYYCRPRFPNTWKTKNRLYLVVLKWIALSINFMDDEISLEESCVADSSPITFPGLTGIPSCYKCMSRVTFPHPPKAQLCVSCSGLSSVLQAVAYDMLSRSSELGCCIEADS